MTPRQTVLRSVGAAALLTVLTAPPALGAEKAPKPSVSAPVPSRAGSAAGEGRERPGRHEVLVEEEPEAMAEEEHLTIAEPPSHDPPPRPASAHPEPALELLPLGLGLLLTGLGLALTFLGLRLRRTP
ncbi:hypothetical protein [Streptomyces sp. TRM68416]|uniref:hypothetical protein n=1 Tax=Streptomyces sp. TRM68416 TaxID=2758412 RepID=UPI001661AD90|nr:hypothetical protein [Streptomyces sp. TRM68416]MBD0841135.1 hypothetical protein [Streptomyces sp. TRM68416]